MLRSAHRLLAVVTIGTAGFTVTAGAQRPATVAVVAPAQSDSASRGSTQRQPTLPSTSLYRKYAVQEGVVFGVLGAALGLAGSVALTGMCEGSSCNGSEWLIVGGTAGGFLVGGGIGALLGLGRAAFESRE